MINRQWVVADPGQSLAQLQAAQIALGNAIVFSDADNVRVLVDVPSGASVLAASDAFIPKGVIDCSGNPNYPAADAGWVYRISVGGKIGGASGDAVEATDRITCNVDGSAAGTTAQVGANWHIERDVVKTSSVPVKASGAEVDTGTDDAKFATAKAIADSKITKGVAAGYKIARSASPVAVTGTADITTGLATVIACFASPDSDFDGATLAAVQAVNTGGAGHILLKCWKVTAGGAAGNPTLIAADAAKNVHWLAIGT